MTTTTTGALAAVAALTLGHGAWAQGVWSSDGETIEVPDGARFEGVDDPAALLEAVVAEAAQGAAAGTGLSVTVVRSGEVLYAGGFGGADLERPRACDADTAFAMASVSKTVTGAAIATLVVDGAIDLDASVREYLPELSETYAPVTVRHLVHHTGGVEDVTGMLALAGFGHEDVATNAEALRVLAGLEHLRFEPGTQHMYSNGGYLMLAEIVERVAGTPLPELARELFFEPLGMSTARFLTGPGDLVPGRAVPYLVEDGEARRAPIGARYGAGGLVGSTRDLARWAEALRTGAVVGGEVAALVRERGTLSSGSTLDYAFGIGHNLDGARERWTHAGSVPGGQSFLAFYPREELSIVAAANCLDGVNVSRLVGELATLLLGPSEETGSGMSGGMIFLSGDQEAPEESEGVVVDPALLATYAGTYEMEDGLVLTVGVDGKRLLIGFEGPPEIEVFPLPSGAFLLPVANYEYHFDPEKDAVRMHVRQSRRTGEPEDVSGKRRTTTLAAEDLAAFVGRYLSPELGAYYEIESDGERLWLVHARHGRMLLEPLTADTFTLPSPLARLYPTRENGAVVGFELEAYSWGARSPFHRL